MAQYPIREIKSIGGTYSDDSGLQGVTPIVTLTSSPVTLTTSWADLGPQVDVRGSYNNVGVYLDIDINDAENARFRVLARHESSGTNYNFPIIDPKTSTVGLNPEYFEFTTDADQAMVVGIDTQNVVNYIQVQIMCTSLTGASYGTVKSGYLTRGWT